MKILAPTMDFNSGVIAKVPFIPSQEDTKNIVDRLCDIAEEDWNQSETSWDFKFLPLLRKEHISNSLGGAYSSLNVEWSEKMLTVKRLEEENNRNYIDFSFR